MAGEARRFPGASIFMPLQLGDFAAGGSIGTAATTVDLYTYIRVAQTTGAQSITIPSPTDAQNGRLLILGNSGTQSVTVTTLAALALAANAYVLAIWDGAAWRKTS